MSNKGMANRNRILDRFEAYEDRLLANMLLEMAERCRQHYGFQCSDFLDPRQQNIARQVLNTSEGIDFYFDGGIEDGERCLCILRHEAYPPEDVVLPVGFLRITWNSERKKLTHRDFLGSILGCGIKREKIGDIILEADSAYVAVDPEISRFLLYNLSKVGSTPVQVAETDRIGKKQETVKVISATVASLRLDCVISAGYHISRSTALELIKSGKVRLNWEEVLAPAKELKEKDVISLRGKGRTVLEAVSGTTKKDRIKVTIHQYT